MRAMVIWGCFGEENGIDIRGPLYSACLYRLGEMVILLFSKRWFSSCGTGNIFYKSYYFMWYWRRCGTFFVLSLQGVDIVILCYRFRMYLVAFVWLFLL